MFSEKVVMSENVGLNIGATCKTAFALNILSSDKHRLRDIMYMPVVKLFTCFNLERKFYFCKRLIGNRKVWLFPIQQSQCVFLLIQADIAPDVYVTMWCHIMEKSNKQEDTQGKAR